MKNKALASQSLWNRAVSYDANCQQVLIALHRLNPFGTGQCLTTKDFLTEIDQMNSLNPFGTGQCLTTLNDRAYQLYKKVSIPLEQGSVLRRRENCTNGSCRRSLNPFGTGQCLTTNNWLNN